MTEEIRDLRIDGHGMLGPLLAIIVYNSFTEPGVTCFTPAELSQQLLYMRHKEGHKIPAHTHLVNWRKVGHTREVLVIKSGSIRIDIYAQDKQFVTCRTLTEGDTILLVAGGHGIEVLAGGVSLIEVKTGPYLGKDRDKVLI